MRSDAAESAWFALSGDTGAIFLVYDYRHTSPTAWAPWSQWTFEDATGGRACLWQDRIVWAQGDSWRSNPPASARLR